MTQDTELEALLREVEAYLAKTGAGATRFGLAAAKDGALLQRMRNGVPMLSTKMSQIRKFMATNPAGGAELAPKKRGPKSLKPQPTGFRALFGRLTHPA